MSRRSASYIVSTVALLMALSGCTTSDVAEDGSAKSKSLGGAMGRENVPFTANWAELAVAAGPEHDHTKAAQHAGLSTPNFEIIGHNPLRSDWYGKPPGGFGCSKTQHDGT